MSQISWGLGRSLFAALVPVSVVASSRMMSLHSSMHSSQMNTEGPAMSFLTSCWLLPQNEQYKTFSLEAPFLSAMDVVGCWMSGRGSAHDRPTDKGAEAGKEQP